jgi:hypothetical protein
VTADRVEVAVVGMDGPHTTEALAQAPLFVEKVESLRRDSCTALGAGRYRAAVQYVPAYQETVVLVHTTAPPPALAWHPSGQFMVTGCPSIVAVAACESWSAQTVFVSQGNDQGVMALGYRCGHHLRMGGGPMSLEVEPRGGPAVVVPLYKPTFSTVVLERSRTLPDGSLNATGVLLSVVGEVPPDPPPAPRAPPAPPVPLPAPAVAPMPTPAPVRPALPPPSLPEPLPAPKRSKELRQMRAGGAIAAGCGLATILGTWGWYLTDPELTAEQWTDLQVINGMGWVGAVGGGVFFTVGQLGGRSR